MTANCTIRLCACFPTRLAVDFVKKLPEPVCRKFSDNVTWLPQIKAPGNVYYSRITHHLGTILDPVDVSHSKWGDFGDTLRRTEPFSFGKQVRQNIKHLLLKMAACML